MMEAHELAKIDREYEISRMAYERRRIEAKSGTKRQTYVYKSLKSFYDYDKQIETVKKAFSGKNESNDKGLNFRALIEKKKKQEGGGIDG